MTHEFELERTALYALGTLPAAEVDDAEAHLLLCAECMREYSELHGVSSIVALSAEVGDEHLLRLQRIKRRLFNAVTPQSKLPRNERRFDRWYMVIAAASILVAVGSALWANALNSKLRASEIAQRESNERAYYASADANAQRSRLAVIFSAGAKIAQVKNGLVVRNAGRTYLVMNKLPALPARHRFQVWLAAADRSGMIPSVLFAPGANGTAFVEIPGRSDRIRAVALTIEPESGSRQPTTKPLFIKPIT